jgi:hypothetical protein
MKRTKVLFLIPLIIALFLSGCVNLEETITINQDGSGSLSFAYGVETEVYPQFEEALPDGLQLEGLLASITQSDLVTDINQDRYEANGKIWQSMQVDVSDMASLLQEERRVGPIILSVDEVEEGFIFTQTIDLALSNVSIPGINLMDLSSAGFAVNLNTPQIVDTNGKQREAGSAEWDISVSELVKEEGGIYLEADYILEPYEGVYIPWDLYFPYVVYGFLGLGILTILLVIIVNTTGRGEKERKLKF